ncbi:PepSY-associated TM helix domain-containing protein [Reichenbachiella sp. MALMAid0571]|uniref:PepSY-associated TM helix domain-containing protein n=1 Tax=Reichenbachiella sp. MALMAid0571 TaxID=3143939 RepID=UPI0032DF4C4A
MNKKLKKFIGQVHLWLGLASGIVVFILGITGCILAFEEEIKDWVYADKLFVEAPNSQQPLPLSDNLKVAQSALEPDMPIQIIDLKNDKTRSYLFRANKRNSRATDLFANRFVYWFDCYTDPYTATVLKKEDFTKEFFRVVLDIHMYLWIFRFDIGHQITAAATLIFVIMLITGLVLWWPKNKAARKQRFWFRWKNTTKWKRKNYDIHNILGFYSMFLALFIALTGLVWAYSWFNDSVQWVANGGKIIEHTHERVQSNPNSTTILHPIDKVHEFSRINYPKADRYLFFLRQDSLRTLGAYVAYDDPTQTVSLEFDQYTGELLKIDSWENKTNGEKVYAYNYDIHVGAIFGLPGKILAFFASLISTSLPVTGFIIWWGRRKKGQGVKELNKNDKYSNNNLKAGTLFPLWRDVCGRRVGKKESP